ncbi:respiratory nitrate reductase subunit gamma [Neobacillus drentensis]|uniref:respiratory nitrate reductase subunit gamma n=1 Tax=Neobacillus drentensis TaxID=220684 RepID=UPI003000BD8F
MLQFLWVIFPYLMITIFLVGHIYRYNFDQLSWTAKSSEFLEKKSLRWGSMLFHIGILFVFAGHVFGLLIPKTVLSAVGIGETLYHTGAVYGGGFAGIVTLIGIIILFSRRLTNKRVRMTSDSSDIITVVFIFLIILIGTYNTLIGNQFHPHFDYRETISPWFRGLLTFTPDPFLMRDVPIGFQLHILISFALIGIWPFTRLVHVWSVPLTYFKRRYIIYRKRAG